MHLVDIARLRVGLQCEAESSRFLGLPHEPALGATTLKDMVYHGTRSSRGHLLSGSDDAQICLWDIKAAPKNKALDDVQIFKVLFYAYYSHSAFSFSYPFCSERVSNFKISLSSRLVSLSLSSIWCEHDLGEGGEKGCGGGEELDGSAVEAVVGAVGDGGGGGRGGGGGVGWFC
ncbi:hypothetical protein RHGRI_007447 [Rhododendron griersonianum]|uniref:Uncharacterized protein n=1 Tax=Rhododendron griersonianum TaxID=479676 RepID=A0AAV6KYE0_9ERIC|nr:hypothetical protein RHGRI_007447 [Rhododendron griersonianum]